VYGDGQFHCTEAGRQVPAGPGHDLHDDFSHFFSNFSKLGTIELFQISRAVYGLKQAQ
jgi:hypothetical protein